MPRSLRAAAYERVYTSDGGPSSKTAWLASRTTVTRDRLLEQWLELVAAGPAVRPDPILLLKRFVKRVR